MMSNAAMSMLDQIQMELENMPDEHILLAPLRPKEEGEVEAGEVPEDLRKLWLLSVFWAKAASEETLKSTFASSRKEADDHETKSYELRAKSGVVSDLVWITIRDRMDLWGEESLNIREGWRVVKVPPTSKNPFLGMLGPR